MNAVKAIVWFVFLVIALTAIFETIGWRGLVNMFPEGRRWWMLPVQFLSLGFFAAVVYFNPWSYHGL